MQADTGRKKTENLSEEAQRHLIKDQSVIYTACGDGKIPFVSAADIAAVAFHALTVAKPPNCDYRVLGPELLTYDQVRLPFPPTTLRASRTRG